MLYKSPATSTHFIYRICLIQGPLFLVRGVLWESRNPILENTENTKIVKRHSTQPKSYKKCLSFLESPKYLSISISILKVLSPISSVQFKCRNVNFHSVFFCKIEICFYWSEAAWMWVLFLGEACLHLTTAHLQILHKALYKPPQAWAKLCKKEMCVQNNGFYSCTLWKIFLRSLLF